MPCTETDTTTWQQLTGLYKSIHNVLWNLSTVLTVSMQWDTVRAVSMTEINLLAVHLLLCFWFLSLSTLVTRKSRWWHSYVRQSLVEPDAVRWWWCICVNKTSSNNKNTRVNCSENSFPSATDILSDDTA